MPLNPTVPTAGTHVIPTLAAIALGCRRGNRILFRGVSFQVRSGEAIWLRGRNGRGKTSLLRTAAGLTVPETGQVLWGGKSVHGNESFSRALVYIGHANALKEDLTVTESLTFLARLHGRPDDSRTVRAALAGVGMDSHRDALVRTLSQGQRRRATLARLALEQAAALWILDEPYDALDADGTAVVNELLRAHLTRGGSVLLTSHQDPGASAPDMAEFDLDPFA